MKRMLCTFHLWQCVRLLCCVVFFIDDAPLDRFLVVNLFVAVDIFWKKNKTLIHACQQTSPPTPPPPSSPSLPPTTTLPTISFQSTVETHMVHMKSKKKAKKKQTVQQYERMAWVRFVCSKTKLLYSNCKCNGCVCVCTCSARDITHKAVKRELYYCLHVDWIEYWISQYSVLTDKDEKVFAALLCMYRLQLKLLYFIMRNASSTNGAHEYMHLPVQNIYARNFRLCDPDPAQNEHYVHFVAREELNRIHVWNIHIGLGEAFRFFQNTTKNLPDPS